MVERLEEGQSFYASVGIAVHGCTWMRQLKRSSANGNISHLRVIYGTIECAELQVRPTIPLANDFPRRVVLIACSALRRSA